MIRPSEWCRQQSSLTEHVPLIRPICFSILYNRVEILLVLGARAHDVLGRSYPWVSLSCRQLCSFGRPDRVAEVILRVNYFLIVLSAELLARVDDCVVLDILGDSGVRSILTTSVSRLFLQNLKLKRSACLRKLSHRIRGSFFSSCHWSFLWNSDAKVVWLENGFNLLRQITLSLKVIKTLIKNVLLIF
jgi:hypothetical protein